jgi:hypothetical protein
LKKEAFNRALEYSLAALTIDPDNTKASFREAQARIGLKQIEPARKILQGLQKVSLSLLFQQNLDDWTDEEHVQ